MISGMTASCIVKFTCGSVGGGLGCDGLLSWRSHSPWAFLVPVRRRSLLWEIMTLSASNVAVQPASQSFPMEIKECDSAGKTCADMLMGAGNGRCPRCVDWIVSPFGMVTVMASFVGVFSCNGYLLVMK